MCLLTAAYAKEDSALKALPAFPAVAHVRGQVLQHEVQGDDEQAGGREQGDQEPAQWRRPDGAVRRVRQRGRLGRDRLHRHHLLEGEGICQGRY